MHRQTQGPGRHPTLHPDSGLTLALSENTDYHNLGGDYHATRDPNEPYDASPTGPTVSATPSASTLPEPHDSRNVASLACLLTEPMFWNRCFDSTESTERRGSPVCSADVDGRDVRHAAQRVVIFTEGSGSQIVMRPACRRAAGWLTVTPDSRRLSTSISSGALAGDLDDGRRPSR